MIIPHPRLKRRQTPSVMLNIFISANSLTLLKSPEVSRKKNVITRMRLEELIATSVVSYNNITTPAISLIPALEFANPLPPCWNCILTRNSVAPKTQLNACFEQNGSFVEHCILKFTYSKENQFEYTSDLVSE